MRLDVKEVCTAFGLGRALGRPRPARGGMLHRVWRLETERGTYAVKALRPPAGLHEIAWLRDYERSFDLERAALAAGVPTPRPVATEDGSWLARTGEATVRVHEWVQGERLPERQAETGPARLAGALLARIHGLRVVRETGPEAVLPTWPVETWQLWEQEVPELRGMAAVQRELNRVMEDARALVNDPVLSHRDVNAKNLLAGPGGALILIDWELAGPVEPALEAAGSALDWAGAFWWEPDPAVARAFLEGYREGGGLFPDNPDIRIFATWLGDATSFAATCHRRALHAETAGERLRARRNAAFMASQIRRGLEARQRWLPLLRA
jgi:aminoglycoside phosphotransferase (APT) family kinase protein